MAAKSYLGAAAMETPPKPLVTRLANGMRFVDEAGGYCGLHGGLGASGAGRPGGGVMARL